jgi:uncharacterized membrane protein YeaQ/YmgE (transglycosylase-associated protein family)
MLDFVVWFVVGAIVGAVAGVLMREEDDRGVFVNVMVGVVGALAAGWFVAPWIGLRVARPVLFNFGALAVALVGAVALLALVGFLRRARQRR